MFAQLASVFHVYVVFSASMFAAALVAVNGVTIGCLIRKRRVGTAAAFLACSAVVMAVLFLVLGDATQGTIGLLAQSFRATLAVSSVGAALSCFTNLEQVYDLADRVTRELEAAIA